MFYETYLLAGCMRNKKVKYWNTRIRRKIKTLFKNERSREFLTFLFFLALSFLFWILQSLNEDAEGNFSIPVKYTDIPEQVMITSELPQKINVRLRDKGTVLMSYIVDRLSPITIDFNHYKNNRGVFVINSPQLSSLIRKQLKNTTNLLYYTPDSIPVYFTNNKGRKFKVHLKGSVSTVPQCIISGPIKLSSDSVTVYAPTSILKNIKEVVTDSFTLKSLTDTTTFNLPLHKIRGAKIVPDLLNVTVPVEELTSKKISLPINQYNLPTGISMVTFPATVDLNFMVPVSRFSKIPVDDFSVGVDFDDVKKAKGNKIPLKVMEKPAYINNIEVVPDSAEFILEVKTGIW